MNIIARRNIEPLLLKAHQVLKHYENAMDCAVSVLDQTGRLTETPDYKTTIFSCELCKKANAACRDTPGEDEYPCTGMHINSIIESRRAGGSYIYMCDLGFIFWTSPLFSGGRYAGALIAGRVLGITRRKVIEKICAIAPGTISEDEARSYLADIPEKNYEEIKAMAQMLLVCAEQIGDGTEDYTEAIKRISEQESRLSTQLHRIRNQMKISCQEKEQIPGYPLEKERMLLAALRRGDNDAGRKILNELLAIIFQASSGNFDFLQFRAMELVVLLSRAALTPDSSEDNTVLENNNRYLKRLQESRTIEDLIENLRLIIDRMAGQIFSFQGIRHASALRKAERFIWENYTRKISLREIADASGLSAPYFSTVFKDEMGENLSNYLNRLRVEKAAVMLVETDLPLNEIAGDCGFEDQSWFSKIFKNYTGISPGKYREQGDCEDKPTHNNKTQDKDRLFFIYFH